ncbi:NADPH-dependent FMN reductase [Geothermobacter ehrlichii]|uniref:NADPH-dependent FMN reductase n=1 Tax=Geothermobacter ehrlichii TaxID=213224 RepID=A0A5D3WJD2_9BACT|nr:flavodoxin family protein [Geothermobacter ehrlichii]TYO98667.1 NADPH-dependent FMN reductase [Geothermobacter ehrlichii]
MTKSKTAIAIVGSYRKGGTVDAAVSEIVSSLQQQGIESEKIYLQDCTIAFCTNCRSCLQTPGPSRGRCIHEDDMENLLQRIEAADVLVIGAPTNAGSVNALTRRFLERCVGFAYWPWGARAPVLRVKTRRKASILVSASGAPALIGRYFNDTMKTLRTLSRYLGARPVGTVWIGGVTAEKYRISVRTRKRIHRLTHKLVEH